MRYVMSTKFLMRGPGKQRVQRLCFRPALRNVFLLEFHPTLSLAAQLHSAIQHMTQVRVCVCVCACYACVLVGLCLCVRVCAFGYKCMPASSVEHSRWRCETILAVACSKHHHLRVLRLPWFFESQHMAFRVQCCFFSMASLLQELTRAQSPVASVTAQLTLERDAVETALRCWREMESPGASYTAQVQKDVSTRPAVRCCSPTDDSNVY